MNKTRKIEINEAPRLGGLINKTNGTRPLQPALSVRLMFVCLWLFMGLGILGCSSEKELKPVNEVTIYRDDWGVPHIYAETEEVGFFGLGYAQAEDRLEGILERYLAVQGKSSSVFGREYLQKDLHNLHWMFAEEARKHFKNLEPRLQKNFTQFIAGIQYYMEQHPGEVPDWAPELDPSLPIAFLNSALWGVNEIMGAEDARNGGVSLAQINDSFVEGLGIASNSWVVSPGRTKGGAVIHLADSHVPFDGDVRIYEFRLHADALHIAGFSASGIALPVQAHNSNIVWGVTMGGPDVADCYAITVDPDHPRRYKYDDVWKEMEVRRVVVEIKGEPPFVQEFEYTHHNNRLSPVVARNENTAYAISSAYMHQSGRLENQLYKMILSKSMAEFKEAMAVLGFFSQNVTAGSADGHILYTRAGRVPIRPQGFDYRMPVNGNVSATEWQGIYPFDSLVIVQDPKAGYLTHNNMAPDMVAGYPPIDMNKYPFEVFYDLPGYMNWRAKHSIELLSKNSRMSIDDAFEIALDEKWENTEIWIEALRKALKSHNEIVGSQGIQFREFIEQILGFDGLASKESEVALKYIYWLKALEDSGQNSSISNKLSNNIELSDDEALLLINAINQGMSILSQDHGTSDPKLGDVYRIGRGGTSYPIGGITFKAGAKDYQTLRAMTSFAPPDSTGHYWIDAGQRQPMVTVFTDPIQSFTSSPYGQSENPNSPHYSDQAELLSERQLKPTYFDRNELMEHVKSKTVLPVELQP